MPRESKVYVTNPSKGKSFIVLGVLGVIIGFLMGISGNGTGWLVMIIGFVLLMIGNISHWFSN